jgi:hypothetical protein
MYIVLELQTPVLNTTLCLKKDRDLVVLLKDKL